MNPLYQIDRPQLRMQAREIIRTSKPSPLLAGLLFTLLSALFSWLSLRLTGVDSQSMMRIMESASNGQTDLTMRLMEQAMPSGLESFLDLLLHVAVQIVGVGFSLFILNSVRRTQPALGNLLDGFGFPLRVVGLLLLEGILIVLWGLLLIIPGIIAAYRYSMAVYIMLDNPDMRITDCLRESKRMTAGYKGQLFSLDLSFLAYIILSMLPVAGYVVQIYLTPYWETARVLFYEKLKNLPVEGEVRFE